MTMEPDDPGSSVYTAAVRDCLAFSASCNRCKEVGHTPPFAYRSYICSVATRQVSAFVCKRRTPLVPEHAYARFSSSDDGNAGTGPCPHPRSDAPCHIASMAPRV